MDDLQGPASDKERDELTARIKRVAGEGRIGDADRDIRLNNVRSARSQAELDLMRRDLDQLEASVGVTAGVASSGSTPAPASAPPASAPYSKFTPSKAKRSVVVTGPTVVVRGNKAVGIAVAIVVVVVLFIAGVIAFVAYLGTGTPSSSPRALPPAASASADAPGDGPTGTSTGPTVAGGFSLSAPGIRSFVTTYQKKFGTTQVVDLVMYGDYVVVNVPVAGGRGRQAGWLYREGNGWTTFGGVRAVFPGSAPVDLKQLNVEALVRNIDRAKKTLNVEKPTQTYVIIRWSSKSSPTPDVNIYASNQFSESGYLATRLDGTVERAYPFGQ